MRPAPNDGYASFLVMLSLVKDDCLQDVVPNELRRPLCPKPPPLAVLEAGSAIDSCVKRHWHLSEIFPLRGREAFDFCLLMYQITSLAIAILF